MSSRRSQKSRISKATIDSLEVFRTADIYHRSTLVLARTFSAAITERGPSGESLNGRLSIPQMMLSAFSSELYLKSLYCIEKGNVGPDVHDLNFFFRNLSAKTKTKMRDHWNEGSKHDILMKFAKKVSPEVDMSLDGSLKAAGDAFRKLRYVYEDVIPGYRLGILPQVLRFTIFDLKPEWKTVFQNAHMLPVSSPPTAEPIWDSLIKDCKIGNSSE